MEKRLNASEMSNLWATYLSNTATVVLLRVYLEHAQDSDISKFLEHALHNAIKSVDESRKWLNQINFPLPTGFGDKDINLKAPRLFSDKVMLLDIWRLSQYGGVILGISLNTSQDKDIREMYTDLLALNMQLFNEAADLSIIKGLHVEAPYIPVPEEAGIIEKESFFGGIFGKRRPLSSLEIKEIVFSLGGMIHAVALLNGFSQVAEQQEIRDFLYRGKEISEKHVEVLQSMLKESDLATLPTFESDVTESTISPFSDRLMIFLIVLLGQLVFSRYGIALSQCARTDLTVDISRLMAEVARYIKDGSDIMIDKQWLEQPPLAPNREVLAKQ